MCPSAVWPTALRALRVKSCDAVKDSFARKTGFPLRTRTGPPPTASRMSLQRGVRIKRIATLPPAGTSAVSVFTCAPRATRTAPFGGIAWLPPWRTCVTGAVSVVFGVAAGNRASTASTVPLSVGVAAPHAAVYSVTAERPGGSFRPSGRNCPVPFHVPLSETRSTWSEPSASKPAAERPPRVPAPSTPPRIRTLDGVPHRVSKKSPLTPTTVADGAMPLSISVRRSRPGTAPFDNQARSEYRPVARGAETTFRATGPCAVNSTCFE